MELTAKDLRKACFNKNIRFIPHHDCALCGRLVGYVISFDDYNEVYFDPSCNCGCSRGFNTTWDDVFGWIIDDKGEIRDSYKWIFE